jgi:hypothetical protein
VLGRTLLKRLGPIGMAITVAQAALVARDHWGLLSASERTRLGKLVRKSAGRPSNLTKREQDELKRLVLKLDPLRLGRSVVTGHRARTA